MEPVIMEVTSMQTSPISTNQGKEEFPVSRADAAAFLRELADQLENGELVEISTAQRRIQLMAHEPLNLEISYREDQKKKKLEVELEVKEYHSRKGSLTSARPTAGHPTGSEE